MTWMMRMRFSGIAIAQRVERGALSYFEPGYIDAGYFDDRQALQLKATVTNLRRLVAKVELHYP